MDRPRELPQAELAAEAESGLDIEALVGKALAGIETRVVELPPP